MKIAVMGDVHANPRSLKDAIADAKALGCAKMWHLGDITGYGYDVKEALRLVRENFDVVLLGNHDAACSDRFPMNLHNHNYDVDRAQAQQLDEGDLEYLRGMPLVHSEDDVACVHGDFTNPSGFHYIQAAGDVLENRCVRDERILFCAHVHLSSVWQVGKDDAVSLLSDLCIRPAREPEMSSFKLDPKCHYVINCGSVGYPRFERSVVYAVLDSDEQTVSIRRLPFDVEAYKRDMAAAMLAIPAWIS